MRMNELAKKIGVASLAIAMMLGIGTALTSTAQAQVPGFAQYRGNWDQYRGNWDLDRDDNYGFYNHGFYNHGFYDRGMVIRIAQRNGYSDGFALGRRDRFSGQGSNCDGSPRYQNAMAGYRFAFGDPFLYRQAYRAGFHRGYENGFRSVGFFRW